MAKLGKRTRAAREALAGKAELTVEEAVALVNGNAVAKFDETVEIAMNLGVDTRHADQMVRGTVVLPNGTGKTMRVAVFARGDKADEAKEAGADAALVVCPYYNRPDQTGIEAHFRAINDAVQLPVFLYNVPGRTVSDILPETVGRLAKLPNIIGIKDATGDLARVTQHRMLAGEDFIQLSGDDPTSLGHRAMGGQGCISVTANVAPQLNADMHKAASQGDFSAARAIELKLIRLHKDLFASPSPGPTKYALAKLGLCEETVRLPITPPDAKTRTLVDEALIAAGLGS